LPSLSSHSWYSLCDERYDRVSVRSGCGFDHPAAGQLAVPNDGGVSPGHIHLYASDVAEHQKFWATMGGVPGKCARDLDGYRVHRGLAARRRSGVSAHPEHRLSDGQRDRRKPGRRLRQATTNLTRWLENKYKLNAAEVSSVLGTAMVYDIAEVVDPYVHVVAKAPKSVLAAFPR
jgi:hypothetical protein